MDKADKINFSLIKMVKQGIAESSLFIRANSSQFVAESFSFGKYYTEEDS